MSNFLKASFFEKLTSRAELFEPKSEPSRAKNEPSLGSGATLTFTKIVFFFRQFLIYTAIRNKQQILKKSHPYTYSGTYVYYLLEIFPCLQLFRSLRLFGYVLYMSEFCVFQLFVDYITSKSSIGKIIFLTVI